MSEVVQNSQMNIYDTIRQRTKPETRLKVQDAIDRLKIDLLDPVNKEAWNNLMEMCLSHWRNR